MGIITSIFIAALAIGAANTEIKCYQDGLTEKQCLERGIEIKNEYPSARN